MKFSHPLARSARVWSATTLDDKVRDILVIVTTLELDSNHKKFKAGKVQRLQGNSTCASMPPPFTKLCW